MFIDHQQSQQLHRVLSNALIRWRDVERHRSATFRSLTHDHIDIVDFVLQQYPIPGLQAAHGLLDELGAEAPIRTATDDNRVLAIGVNLNDRMPGWAI